MCKIYSLYKCANTLYRAKVPLIPRVIYCAMRVLFAAHVPYTATIGSRTWFGCGALGVVLHPRTVIGSGCIIAQNVTIGGRANLPEVPRLGNNVFVGAGAKILGPITIGDNARIGANAVVVRDVPSNATVVGVPAQIVSRAETDSAVGAAT
jgi:serine O-acetyltransferase